MAMLVIRTQVRENYGAHNWDGSGACPQYWKNKGGHDYKVLNVPLNIDLAEIVAASGVETSDNYFEEYVIDWSVECDDYMSWFEKSQLEYDGEILFPEPVLDCNELLERI